MQHKQCSLLISDNFHFTIAIADVDLETIVTIRCVAVILSLWVFHICENT